LTDGVALRVWHRLTSIQVAEKALGMPLCIRHEYPKPPLVDDELLRFIRPRRRWLRGTQRIVIRALVENPKPAPRFSR
jgi:hypothetical protein